VELEPGMIDCRGLQWGPAGYPLTPPLNLQLRPGSLTGVIGSNGSGKSSLLKVIAGLQKPLGGRLELATQRLGGVAYLLQQQALDRQFPISLQALVSAGLWRSNLSRKARHSRLRQVLDDWQLLGLENRPLQALSGGELQRALLARLSLTDAQVLLLDEPDAALDQQGQQLLWRHIAGWQAEGRTQLVVCHHLATVRQHLPDVLQIAHDGCRFAPVSRLIATESPLERVA